MILYFLDLLLIILESFRSFCSKHVYDVLSYIYTVHTVCLYKYILVKIFTFDLLMRHLAKIFYIFYRLYFYMLYYCLRGGSIVLYRTMQSGDHNIWLFIGLSLLHGVLNVLNKATLNFRIKVWTFLVQAF